MNHYLILLFFSPVAAFGVHFCLAWMTRPWQNQGSSLVVAAVAVLIGGWGVLFAGWRIYLNGLGASERFWGVAYGVLVYGGLSFSYFQLFAMTETARRIRIVRELFLRGPLPIEELRVDYGADKMLAIRFDRMVALGQLVQQGDHYVVGGKLLLVVGKIMAGWAKVLGFQKKDS